MQILSRCTNACLWEGEAATMRDAVIAARKAGVDLRGSVLRGSVLRGVDLTGVDLTGAVLTGTVLTGSVLTGSVLRGVDLRGVDLRGVDLMGADLTGAVLRGADLRGAVLRDAVLKGVDLRGADLRGAVLRDAVLRDAKIKALRCFAGLYRYQIWAVVMEDGSPWIRIGCQWRSVEEWDRVTIRESRTSDFPNDGSERSEQRARAFEFARNEAVLMAAKFADAPCTP